MKRSGQQRSQRQLRVGERVRQIIVETLQREFFKSPALGNASTITVSEVQVSPDLRQATAFVMPLGGINAEEIVDALNEEAFTFSHHVAKNLQSKNTPKVKFGLDTTFDQADHINTLLKS